MRLVVIGGVASGATAAARARRIDEDAEILLLERGPYVSYANCGLPYFISGDIQERSDLLLQTPESFKQRYNVDVRVNTEAIAIDRTAKRVQVRTQAGTEWIPYDTLILAQGGNPIMPPLPGMDAPHVFRMWTVPDTDRLDAFIREAQPRSAVVVGGGFIGLEMAEAFRHRGLDTTVIELQPTVMPNMDPEFGHQIEAALSANGVTVLNGKGLRAVHPETRTVELTDGQHIPAELVLFSVGVRPELTLAKEAGLTIGPSGGLQVDEYLQTSDPSIYASGDMIEVLHRISGRQVRVPLAGPANRQGRIAACNALGIAMPYHGALGTSVVKIFESTAAMTGLSEKGARDAGFDVGVAVIHKDHHAGYYPGGKELHLKLVYDRPTAKLLGAQAFGLAGVEKRIDVLATALHGALTLHDLAELDLAYAPPYSSANDPINLAAFVGLNDLSGYAPLVTAAALKDELAGDSPPWVLDVRRRSEFEASHLRGSLNIPVDELRERLDEVPKGRLVITCHTGMRAHVALRILKNAGHREIANLTGGHVSLLREGGFDMEAK